MKKYRIDMFELKNPATDLDNEANEALDKDSTPAFTAPELITEIVSRLECVGGKYGAWMEIHAVEEEEEQRVETVCPITTPTTVHTHRTEEIPGVGIIHEMSTKLPGGGRITGIFG